jgi:hypothetical protein
MSRQKFKSKIDQAALGAALKKWLKSQPGMSRSKLAEETHVHVSVVSRAVTGDYRLLSKAIGRVFTRANLNPDSYRLVCDPSGNKVLMSALHGVWDGTPKHARAIASIIRSLDRLA